VIGRRPPLHGRPRREVREEREEKRKERKERKERDVAAGDIVPAEAAREREPPLRHTA
jgi:hypothetical protein